MLHPTRFAFVADSLRSGRFLFALHLALVLGVAGCAATVPAGAPRSTPPPAAGAGQVKPSDDVEATVLKRLDGWPAGQAWAVGGVSVTAEAAYAAASGRHCRSVTFARGAGATTRLACHDGARWFYVPDVFASTAASAAR